MLPKKERLDRAAFSRFFASGRRMHSPFATLMYHTHDSFHGAVVVPKKVVRTAVGRNRLRRRTYDIVRRYAHRHELTGVYILIMKRDAVSASAEDLREGIHELLGRTADTR